MELDHNYPFQGKRQLRPDRALLNTTGTGPGEDITMFDLDGVLLSPDRRLTSLSEGGERGFRMACRFNCIGKQLVKAGVLVLICPKASSRHVLDPLSVASSRL